MSDSPRGNWIADGGTLRAIPARGRVSPRPGMSVERRLAPAIPTDLEPASRPAGSSPIRRSGYGRFLQRPSRWHVVRASGDGRGESRLACVPSPGRSRPHVAGSLRDPERVWNNAKSLRFRWIRPCNGEFASHFTTGGMERSECESRRDSPTCRSHPACAGFQRFLLGVFPRWFYSPFSPSQGVLCHVRFLCFHKRDSETRASRFRAKGGRNRRNAADGRRRGVFRPGGVDSV